MELSEISVGMKLEALTVCCGWLPAKVTQRHVGGPKNAPLVEVGISFPDGDGVPGLALKTWSELRELNPK